MSSLRLASGTAIFDIGADSFWLKDSIKGYEYQIYLQDALSEVSPRDKVVVVVDARNAVLKLKNLTSGLKFSTIQEQPYNVDDCFTCGFKEFYRLPLIHKISLITPQVNLFVGCSLALKAVVRCIRQEDQWEDFWAGFAAFVVPFIVAMTVAPSRHAEIGIQAVLCILILTLAPLAGTIVYFGMIKTRCLESSNQLIHTANSLMGEHKTSAA